MGEELNKNLAILEIEIRFFTPVQIEASEEAIFDCADPAMGAMSTVVLLNNLLGCYQVRQLDCIVKYLAKIGRLNSQQARQQTI